MALETLTRAAKQYYEQFFLQAQNGIDKMIFRNEDMDNSASFVLDTLTNTPASVVYRDKDNQSHVLPYRAGSGQQIDIPRASEKTPIDEELADNAIAGVEPNSSYAQHQAALLGQIMRQHVDAHNMRKWKQAIDVIFDGEFKAPGINGKALGLNVDYGRSSSQEITYDFTTGSGMLEALAQMIEQARATGTPLENLVVLMGKNWLSQFQSDSNVLQYLESNTANTLMTSQMMPPALRPGGTFGVYPVAHIRPQGAVAPVWVTSFAPGVSYYDYPDASATPWIPDNEAALFSLADPTWRVYRGVQAIQNNEITRQVGELVIDGYHEYDPPTDFLRSQTRHLYVMGDIDHTVVSTGTFA